MTVFFTIPYPVTKAGKSDFCRKYGMNALYSGGHWSKRAGTAKELHTLAIACMKKARVRQVTFDRPVAVRFLWDDRMDIDNHAVLGKAFLDACKGRLIVNDSPKWVRSVTHEFWDRGCMGVEIREVD